jgi:hypothetical protein
MARPQDEVGIRLMPRINLLGTRSAITAPSYTTQGVDNQNGAAYLHRGAVFTGMADGPLGIFSCWFALTAPYSGSGGAMALLRNHTSLTCSVALSTTLQLSATLTNSGGTISLSASTANPIVAVDSVWHSLICAWDTNHAAGLKIFQAYLDGVNLNPTITDAGAAFNVNYTHGDYGIGAADNGISLFRGYMDEVYFNSAEFLDMSNLVNRYKFRGLTDHPANLGADGSTPTGTQPICYIKGGQAAWATNLGSGGNLTKVGTFLDSPTNP